MKHAKEPPKGNPGVIIISVLLLLSAAGLLFVARRIPGFAQWYTLHIYTALQGTYGRFTGLFTFSVSEVLCIALPVMLLIDIIACRHRLRRAAGHILLTVSLLFFLYSANCGVNYYRDPFVPAEVYEEAEFTSDDLCGFCEFIISNLNDEELAGTGSNDIYPDKSSLASRAVTSMEDLSSDHPELRGVYTRPKQLTVLSRLFSSMGVSGIYSPFTIEANINGEMPDMEKPFTACHELSHLRGYMNEGEANYIGWLACISSDDPAFRRSGWLIAWTYAGSTLRKTDPESFVRLYAQLPDYAVRELEDNHTFWMTHETGASEVQDRVNDAYLKTNGLEDGIESYGQVTTLMLHWFRQNNF